MANISDIIQQFIMSMFEEEESVDLSRNELADFFKCAPSQINYVLSTRFTPLNGYDVESRRGGGGYIRIVKIGNDNTYKELMSMLNQPLSFIEGVRLLDHLLDRLIITENEYNIIKASISDKALSSPLKNADITRSKILKQILLELNKRGDIK